MPYISNLFNNNNPDTIIKLGNAEDMSWFIKQKKRVHVFALGDVGSTLLMGLKLLGNDSISAIGIYDVREAFRKRWEMEMNQVIFGASEIKLPPVEMLEEEDLFSCDVFVFCASLGIPPVTEKNVDVRMDQYEANAGLVKKVAGQAVAAGFEGLFAIVSDPVDPLCRAAVSVGLSPYRVKGYGLGVMNARATYYAEKDFRFSSYLSEGMALGPHGQDLVIANSIEHYEDELSKELTRLTVEANLRMRDLGFKPYLAPALSSGALSILATLEGKWHYSSVCLGDIFFGIKNRLTPYGIECVNPNVPEALYLRLEHAYENLKKIPV